MELKTDYFYNEKNKELYEKYNKSYNEMVEAGISRNFYYDNICPDSLDNIAMYNYPLYESCLSILQESYV